MYTISVIWNLVWSKNHMEYFSAPIFTGRYPEIKIATDVSQVLNQLIIPILERQSVTQYKYTFQLFLPTDALIGDRWMKRFADGWEYGFVAIHIVYSSTLTSIMPEKKDYSLPI